MKQIRIGVFDSGVGGENVVSAIRAEIPQTQVIFRNDQAHLPYGNKTPEELLTFLYPIIQMFETDEVEAVVIACNTASTNVISELRVRTDIPLIGFEPMIKPASTLTQTGTIAVCATPGTLGSKRYHYLKEQFGAHLHILEPDCSDWASLIEDDALSDERLRMVISECKANDADVLVLGCTHYHWIEERLDDLSGPNINVIQPTDSVISELKRVLNSSKGIDKTKHK